MDTETEILAFKLTTLKRGLEQIVREEYRQILNHKKPFFDDLTRGKRVDFEFCFSVFGIEKVVKVSSLYTYQDFGLVELGAYNQAKRKFIDFVYDNYLNC